MQVLLSGGAPSEYEEIVVDAGNAILPDTTLSPAADYLYVLSTSSVYDNLAYVKHANIF